MVRQCSGGWLIVAAWIGRVGIGGFSWPIITIYVLCLQNFAIVEESTLALLVAKATWVDNIFLVKLYNISLFPYKNISV